MYTINLIPYRNSDVKNEGDCREWAVCRYFGIERVSHDHSDYIHHSDVELPNGMNISVKSKDFSLMGGTLCKGCQTFEGIWRRYYKNCHSNLWIYVSNEWIGYVMNKKEFSKFVHTFGRLARESKSKGGGLKIRNLKQSQRMIAWLNGYCK